MLSIYPACFFKEENGYSVIFPDLDDLATCGENLEEAMTMADRIAIMDRGQFVQIGGPREIYENPNCRFCAEFIGSVNLFDCTLISSNATQSLLRADDFTHLIELQHDIDLADGMPLTIALRPEKILYFTRKTRRRNQLVSRRSRKYRLSGRHFHLLRKT